jgi:hypothetical protein
MYFRCNSDNKTPVPINTEEFLDQPNILPWVITCLFIMDLIKWASCGLLLNFFHPFRQFKSLAIVPLAQVHLRVVGVPG